MTSSQRIDLILEREGLNQKQLAEVLNTSDQSITNWKKRDSIGAKSARLISSKYGYRLEWLLTGAGEPLPSDTLSDGENYEKIDSIPPETEWGRVESWDDSTPLRKDEVAVPFLRDIEFACGDGSVSDEDYNGFMLRFSKATLRRVGANSDGSGVLCFPAHGDSMEPRISNGATVAVNTADKKIIDGKMYAINESGWKRIKMLFRTGPDSLSIRSYNKDDYPDEEKKLSDIEIIGRVFWWSEIDY